MNTVIENLRKELISNADEKTRKSGERFFKEDVTLYGVKSAVVGQIAKEHYRSLPGQDKKFIFMLCEELFGSGIMEESFVACNWSYFVYKQYEPGDMAIFERWIGGHVSNWATCDTLCNHTVGMLIERYPAQLKRLKSWTKSENRWMKRASAVSLIVPARKGLFLGEILEIAGILLADKDDMVQKGYGWMLKVASHKHLTEVFDFVIRHKSVMPRTALRYAIEKMPSELKAEAMRK